MVARSAARRKREGESEAWVANLLLESKKKRTRRKKNCPAMSAWSFQFFICSLLLYPFSSQKLESLMSWMVWQLGKKVILSSQQLLVDLWRLSGPQRKWHSANEYGLLLAMCKNDKNIQNSVFCEGRWKKSRHMFVVRGSATHLAKQGCMQQLTSIVDRWPS